MKLTSQQITVLAATSEMSDDAADKFCGITQLTEPRELKRLTDEGFLSAAIVHVDGVPEYCFWYHLDSARGFHVNAAVKLIWQPTDFGNLVSGIEQAARNSGAVYVRFNSNRAGLVPLAEKFGYQPAAVCFTKRL